MGYSAGDVAMHLITKLEIEFAQLKVEVGCLKRQVETLESEKAECQKKK